MKKIFEFVLFGHLHNWEDVYRENYFDTSYGTKIAKTIVVQKCTKCSKYRNDDVYGWLPELNSRIRR